MIPTAEYDALTAAQEKANGDLRIAARIWRDYRREKNKTQAAHWLRKLEAAVDAFDAAQAALLRALDGDVAEMLEQERQLRAFEAEGGRLDVWAERFDDWRAGRVYTAPARSAA